MVRREEICVCIHEGKIEGTLHHNTEFESIRKGNGTVLAGNKAVVSRTEHLTKG